jgi:hypothetical protein
MDLEQLVRHARRGDLKAFVELMRRFQHLAYGSALALVQDLTQGRQLRAFFGGQYSD